MAKKIDVAGQLNSATTEGIIADASQVRINDDSTVDKEVENLNANTGISEYETFSDQKAYSAGTTVLYNGLLYTFTTDHAAGAWDESQVEETSLKKEIVDLTVRKQQINVDKTLSSQYRSNLGKIYKGQKLYCEIRNLKIQGSGYLQLYNITKSSIIINEITADGIYNAVIEDDGELVFIININGDCYIYCDVECVIYGQNSLFDKLKEENNKLLDIIHNSTYYNRDTFSVNEIVSRQYRKNIGSISDNTSLFLDIKNVAINGDGYIQIYNNTTKKIILDTVRTDRKEKLKIEQGGEIYLILNAARETVFNFDVEYVFYKTASLFDDITRVSEIVNENKSDTDKNINIISNVIGIGENNNKGHIIDSYNYDDLFPQCKTINIILTNNTSYPYPKLGHLPTGTTIKVITKNLKFDGSGSGFNIQIFDRTNSKILDMISAGGNNEIEYTLIAESEIWIPINIVGGTLSGEIKVIYGQTIYENRLIATWSDGMTIKDGILSEITLKAPKGVYEFALGTIDQRNWAIVRKKFSIEKLNDGIETLNVKTEKVLILEGEFLFLYLNNPQIYVENYTNNENESFIFGDENASLAEYSNSDGFGGSIYFSWNSINIDSVFAFKEELDKTNNSVTQNTSLIQKINSSINVLEDTQNGNKYKIISVNGIIQLKNITYSKVLFLGNSLLTGFGERGMASTKSGLDYFGHIIKALTDVNPSATYKKISIANWERTLDSNFDNLFSSIGSWDYDLIIYQGGDNVNDSSNYGNALLNLANYLRNKCSNAEIVITGCLLSNRSWAEEAAYNASNAIKAKYISYNGWESQIGVSNIYLENDEYKPSYYAIQTHLNDVGFLDVSNKILQSIGYDEIPVKHNITVNSSVKYSSPNVGVENGIVTIKTYGDNEPIISISNSIQITHLKLSEYEYDNRLSNGQKDTATYSSIFIMPDSDVIISLS